MANDGEGGEVDPHKFQFFLLKNKDRMEARASPGFFFSG